MQNDIQKGDKVVAQVGNEFSIPFKQVPFTVVQKNGNSVLIKGGSVQ